MTLRRVRVYKTYKSNVRESIRAGWNYRSISVVDVTGVISHCADFQRSLVNMPVVILRDISREVEENNCTD